MGELSLLRKSKLPAPFRNSNRLPAEMAGLGSFPADRRLDVRCGAETRVASYEFW